MSPLVPVVVPAGGPLWRLTIWSDSKRPAGSRWRLNGDGPELIVAWSIYHIPPDPADGPDADWVEVHVCPITPYGEHPESEHAGYGPTPDDAKSAAIEKMQEFNRMEATR